MGIDSTSTLFSHVWGKTDKDNVQVWHPLIHHLLDASAVSQILWEQSLSVSFKDELSAQFGLSSEETESLISFWVGIHDIGKAGPEFQKKNSYLKDILASSGFVFPTQEFTTKGFHGTATTIILKRLFKEIEPGLPRTFRNGLATTIGGHHGEFPDTGLLIDPEVERLNVGDGYWQTLQKEIYLTCKEVIQAPEPTRFPQKTNQLNPILLLILGFTIVADWISSNETYFPFEQEQVDPRNYLEGARKKALEAIRILGWAGWQAGSNPIPFESLFPDFKPNSLQQAVISLTEKTHSPFLAIIEAQTGSGKTEAALYMADTVLQRENKSGIYIAMPTQATSNQMFSRMSQFLSKRYADSEINLHLVHGKALLTNNEQQFTPSNIYSEGNSDEGNIHSHTWFLPRKRTLLAPFGVGTVDQTFLSVLRTRHFFLRLFGLSHKVLIFDEVHAYDIYMTEIFKTLLHWLKAVGTSVIILTATLPEKKKQELLDAYSSRRDVLEVKPIPRISIATGDGIQVIQAGDPSPRQIHLEWIGKESSQIADQVEERLKDGGCAAVICNTVGKAQEVYQTLRQTFDGKSCQVLLFHSRFPFCWRNQIEQDTLRYFGKDRSQRPVKAVLVATQVIEQSLDLDFDLMITELAPIDLLIQRIGRLHRHNAGGSRPYGLQEPVCIISSYSNLEETIRKGGDQYVYEPYILGKTFNALRKLSTIDLPTDSDDLLRQVYENSIDDDGLLAVARKKMKETDIQSQQNAHNYLIPMTGVDFIGTRANFFGDDSETLSRHSINAPTREIEPSIQVVCLEHRKQGLFLIGDQTPIDLNKELKPDQVRKCLELEVTISNKYFLIELLKNEPTIPEGFRQSAALRWHFPMVFQEGQCLVGTFRLTLDKEVGLSIEKITS